MVMSTHQKFPGLLDLWTHISSRFNPTCTEAGVPLAWCLWKWERGVFLWGRQREPRLDLHLVQEQWEAPGRLSRGPGSAGLNSEHHGHQTSSPGRLRLSNTSWIQECKVRTQQHSQYYSLWWVWVQNSVYNKDRIQNELVRFYCFITVYTWISYL